MYQATTLPREWCSLGEVLRQEPHALRPIFEKYTDEQSQFLLFDDGRRIHYRIEGRGEPLLCLHGAFASLHAFDGWTNELKDDFQIIRLDMPGFGLSTLCDDDDCTMRNMVEHIKFFLDKIGIESCHVAGSSLGGWVAWELALKHPALVRKLILIDPAGYLDPASIPVPFKMARTPFFNRLVRYTFKRSIMGTFIRQVFCDPKKATDEIIDRFYELNNYDNNAAHFVRYVNTRLVDHTNLLHKINHPTLIMWGKQDGWIPLDNAYRFNLNLPNAELIVYDGAGHIPMEECPKITAADARAFLNRADDEWSENEE